MMYRNTVTVGIFYALPAFQLVLSEQQVCVCLYALSQCMSKFVLIPLRFLTSVAIRTFAITTLSVLIPLVCSVPSIMCGVMLVM